MKASELQKLRSLLNSPEEFHEAIEVQRANVLLDEASKGFIDMYDELGGDIQAIKTRLEHNKSFILSPLQASKKQITWRKLLPYAAILIACFSAFYIIQSRKETIEFSSQYNDPGLPNYMSSGTTNKLELVMFYYRKENYSVALAMIESAIKYDPENDTLLYYNALMNQLTKNEQKSVKEYQQISNSSSPFKDRARYFLAIIYAKRNQPGMAIRIFKKLCHSTDVTIASFSREHLEKLGVNQYNK